jgi:diguanylate cyclase (GGDEF)-like protein
VVDIDHFKQVNDHWGHAAGDLVLAEVARALRQVSPHPLAVGRLGGDEFVGIYPAATRADLAAVAAAVVAAVDRKPTGDRPAVTISVGACTQALSRLRHDWYQCLAEADALLYQAKNGGRNTAALGDDAAA